MSISQSDIRVTGALTGGGPGGADDDPNTDGGYLTVFFDSPEGSEDVQWTGDSLALQRLLTAVCNAAVEWLTVPEHLAHLIGSTSESTLVEVSMETADEADDVAGVNDGDIEGGVYPDDDDPFRGLF